MKLSLPSTQSLPDALPTLEAEGWRFGLADVAIVAVLLSISVGASVPLALHYREQTRRLDAERMEVASRCRMMRGTTEHLEASRASVMQLRRAADRYIAEAEARPIVPWTTAVAELSRRRPEGVWTTRLSGNGPRFRAEFATRRPELAQQYTRNLRQSPYVEFAELPAGEMSGPRAQVVGRLMGE